MKGIIVVLVNHSDVDVNPIIKELLRCQTNVALIPSVTTREAKKTDELGKYNYISNVEFFDIVEAGGFLEYETHNGNYYGTLYIRTEELDNHDLLFSKDANGALSIKSRHPKAITIYILPKEEEQQFKDPINHEYSAARELDFLVIHDTINDTVSKIVSTIEFMRKNGMRKRWN